MINPKYTVIAAITIDGKIAKDPGHMSDWTSKEDKDFLHKMLDKSDVVIVGNHTYKTAIKPLSKRNCIVFTRSIPRGVVSPFMGCYQKSNNLLFCDPNKANLKKLISELKYKKIALLGGAQTYSYFLENNLLDEIYLTIEPLAFGTGISLFSNKKPGDYKFKLVSIKKLNKKGSVLLRYARH